MSHQTRMVAKILKEISIVLGSVTATQKVLTPRKDRSSCVDEQKKQAERIKESYKKGSPEGRAAQRAWATVNKLGEVTK